MKLTERAVRIEEIHSDFVNTVAEYNNEMLAEAARLRESSLITDLTRANRLIQIVRTNIALGYIIIEVMQGLMAASVGVSFEKFQELTGESD